MHIKHRIDALVEANVALGQTVRNLKILLDVTQPPEVRKEIDRIIRYADEASQKASDAINSD